MRMKKSFNFKPTLSIRQLKDNPDVDKSFSLSLPIWASLGDRSLLEKGRVRWVSLLFWGPTNLIPFGDLLVDGSEKDSSLSLSLLPSLGGWQAVRVVYFHFIHAFGNGRRSYASKPIAKSVEWKCSKKCRRPMQSEFQITYFANNNKWRYLYSSCTFKAWQLLNDNSFYSLITHQLHII